jgi:hypothetical protein
MGEGSTANPGMWMIETPHTSWLRTACRYLRRTRLVCRFADHTKHVTSRYMAMKAAQGYHHGTGGVWHGPRRPAVALPNPMPQGYPCDLQHCQHLPKEAPANQATYF